MKPNRIMPEPTAFLSRRFPICSILRPTETTGAAVGVVNGLAASGLFTGQSQEFFTAATALAQAADAATRGLALQGAGHRSPQTCRVPKSDDRQTRCRGRTPCCTTSAPGSRSSSYARAVPLR